MFMFPAILRKLSLPEKAERRWNIGDKYGTKKRRKKNAKPKCSKLCPLKQWKVKLESIAISNEHTRQYKNIVNLRSLL